MSTIFGADMEPVDFVSPLSVTINVTHCGVTYAVPSPMLSFTSLRPSAATPNTVAIDDGVSTSVVRAFIQLLVTGGFVVGQEVTTVAAADPAVPLYADRQIVDHITALYVFACNMSYEYVAGVACAQHLEPMLLEDRMLLRDADIGLIFYTDRNSPLKELVDKFEMKSYLLHSRALAKKFRPILAFAYPTFLASQPVFRNMLARDFVNLLSSAKLSTQPPKLQFRDPVDDSTFLA